MALSNLLSVQTRWIDWDGSDGDPRALFNRGGDSTADFLIHTLGWIRINKIADSYDVALDPRAVRPEAIAALEKRIHDLEHEADEVWLMTVRTFTGQDWISFTGTAGDQILPQLRQILQFGMDPCIPSAITRKSIDGWDPALGDREVEATLARWRMSGGRLSIQDGAVQSLLARQRDGGSVKILARDVRGRVVVGAYTASKTTLWDPNQVAHFVGTPVVESMPDRGLGSAVAAAAEQALETNEVQAERWDGLLLSSDGRIIDLTWDRLSLPIELDGSDTKGVLVVSQRITPLMVRHAS